jgi:hypothetical protein
MPVSDRSFACRRTVTPDLVQFADLPRRRCPEEAPAFRLRESQFWQISGDHAIGKLVRDDGLLVSVLAR